MSLSDTARKIIKEQLDTNKGGNATLNKVNYTVTTGLLKDKGKDGTVATVNFKFSKPVSEDLLNVQLGTILKNIASSLSLEDGFISLDGLLAATLGKTRASKIGRKRTSGNVQVNFGDPNDGEGSSGAVRSTAGRFVSNSNMRSLLEIVAKNYLIKEMQRGGAPLKFRTGRFANSLRIKEVLMKEVNGRPPELDVTYNYMTRPYSVFNPLVSTYRNLSLRPFRGARNPQKLIGEAIAKAIRDLIHSRYKAVVKQGT